MMKWIGRFLGAAVVLVVLLAAGSLLLPRHIEVARSTVIDAPPEAIFPHVNSMQATMAWSPWMGRDPDMTQTFSGPESGLGNAMEWQSEEPTVGNGTQEITKSVPNERVETALDFGPQGKADAYFELAAVDGGTELTWGFHTDAGYNPMFRYMGLMFDTWIGADYENGLANIKTLVETDS